MDLRYKITFPSQAGDCLMQLHTAKPFPLQAGTRVVIIGRDPCSTMVRSACAPRVLRVCPACALYASWQMGGNCQTLPGAARPGRERRGRKAERQRAVRQRDVRQRDVTRRGREAESCNAERQRGREL